MTCPVPQHWQSVAEMRERRCWPNGKIPQTSTVKTLKAAFQLFARQAPDPNNVACLAMVGSRCTFIVVKLAESAGMPDMSLDLSIPVGQ